MYDLKNLISALFLFLGQAVPITDIVLFHTALSDISNESGLNVSL